MKNSLSILTFNLDDNKEIYRLDESCKKYGYELSVVGGGNGFRDFRQLKIDLLLEELYKVKHSFVMFTDGLDSWFLKPNILELYKEFKSPVVISGNRDCYPDSSDCIELSTQGNTSFKYVCSSQFIGSTKAVIQSLETIKAVYDGYTDQEGWNYCIAKNLIPAVIDYDCKLFLNMTQVELEELDEDFRLKETGNIPASIHFGGPKGDDPNYHKMVTLFKRWKND